MMDKAARSWLTGVALMLAIVLTADVDGGQNREVGDDGRSDKSIDECRSNESIDGGCTSDN